jgi:hypothetical protein
MSQDLDLHAQLNALADDLAPPAWLHEQVRELAPEEVQERIRWLHREARDGRSHALCGFLGPETMVTVQSGQIRIRRYIGVDVRDV